MDIIFIKDINNELSDIFNDYDNCSKKIFETSGVEQQKNIKVYRKLKKIIDEWSLIKIKNVDTMRINEYEYQEKIKNIVARNLLSNGLYLKKDIDEILNQYGYEIESEIKNKIITFYDNYNGKVLIWNMDVEI